MAESIARIADSELRYGLIEALDDIAWGTRQLGDHTEELIAEIGKRHHAAIRSRADAARKRAEEKRAAFEQAIGDIDLADSLEENRMLGFKEKIAVAEAVATTSPTLRTTGISRSARTSTVSCP